MPSIFKVVSFLQAGLWKWKMEES